MVALVLIPGLVSDMRVWRALECAVDMPTHRADVTRDGTIEAMASRLLGDLEGPFVAVGHSMGGRVAMEAARQAPDRVRALVLANTGHGPQKAGELAKRQAKIDLGHKDMAMLAAEWLPPMLDPARAGDQALVSELKAMVVAAGPLVHERQIKALLARPDAATYLPAITCPILLLTGAQDGWSPEAQHREIAALASNTELKIIENAGHFLPIERPVETVAAITQWLVRNQETINAP